jgi:hypothetical protein
VVLAGEHERPQQLLAVDGRRAIVGVLGDDRVEVGQQLALERREIGRQLEGADDLVLLAL